ncbi:MULTISPECIES: DUF5313 family protein [Gordonia]|jgi:hypothetical protein|uniref:DUF5313 domain-containing protein n=1 Tax=Gordonia malaquae NBRC 108250 TaxID=1223542 RepID=M3T9D3_GORML|nr:DUF5313 family protein [Gordonia malaquae]GAC78051.1 hypothetical protein GM1_002_00290 [Gordonia malaquae NBRC 108250]SED90742.1 hypothetical protein SAMN04488550_3443 [Gordonia malaquae]
MSATRPGLLQKIGYLLGRPLPTSMREWVRNDLTGPGHVRRYIVRGLIPLIPLLVGFWFIPGPLLLRGGMMLLILIPFVYFQIALIRVYRRHLLINNGLDASLVDAVQIQRADAVADDYRQRFGR